MFQKKSSAEILSGQRGLSLLPIGCMSAQRFGLRVAGIGLY